MCTHSPLHKLLATLATPPLQIWESQWTSFEGLSLWSLLAACVGYNCFSSSTSIVIIASTDRFSRKIFHGNTYKMARTEWEQTGMWQGWMRTDSIYLGETKWVRGGEAPPPSPRCLDLSCYLAPCLTHTCNAIGLTNTTAPCLLHVRTTRHNESLYICLLGVWQAIGYNRIPTR